MDSKAALCIESSSEAYKGYPLQCSQVPTTANIALVHQSIINKSLNGVKLDSGLVLPASKSYLKVLEVLVMLGSATITPAQVEIAIMSSHLHTNFALVGQIHLVHNVHSLDMSSAYFEVWGSQAGTWGKSLAQSIFQFGPKGLCIVKAIANPGEGALCTQLILH
jgi:hypothetical protein